LELLCPFFVSHQSVPADESAAGKFIELFVDCCGRRGENSSIPQKPLHKICKRRGQPVVMRNPITPSPNRPIPLPDCILRDGWWVVERADERQVDLRVIAGARDEGRIERHHRRDDRENNAMGTGR
jgi:hypothetical protein